MSQEVSPPQRNRDSIFREIAMSLRDTTTDENELAMGYTVPQERLRRGRSSTWCYEPATNLIGDVFRHPPSVAPTREARRERSLSKDVQLAACLRRSPMEGTHADYPPLLLWTRCP